MHLLYVVEFIAEGRNGVVALDRLISHVRDWLGRGLSGLIPNEDLLGAGQMDLVDGPDGSARLATWEFLEVADSRVLRVDVTQQLESGVDFITRVTVGRSQGRTSFRVGMSRESQRSGALTPVGFTPVFQPTLVGAVARDPDLHLRAGGQTVDDRYLQLPNPDSTLELVDALDRSSRLPVLLIHTRSQAAWNVARDAARKLIGLVRVVTLSNVARSRLAASRPAITVPFGGARLVWSDARASGASWSGEEILVTPPGVIRDAVMRLVAPVSALYRGTDHVWQEVRRLNNRLAAEGAAQRAELAESADDLAAQVRELKLQVGTLKEANDDLGRLAESYARDAEEFALRAEQADAAEAEAKYWRETYTATRVAAEEPEVDPWTQIPMLQAAADPIESFLAIEDAADGHIVFTDGAAKSWKAIAYPQPDDMLLKLTALARAAVQLYGADPGSIGHVDDWFRVQHGLKVATSDDTIEKSKALRYFVHEGEQFDQTPHVKVRDGVRPNQVGRIHFAMDSERKRFIVNHVALKLY